jgi:hypothetical protein
MATIKSALVTIMVSVALPACSAMTLRSDPKAGPIRKVCLLPADATLTRIGMKGGASLSKESEEWARKLEATFKHALSASGGEDSGDLSLDALQHDDQTRQLVLRLKQKYESVAVQMLKKPGGVRKARYTLGDEVSLIPCAQHADTFAFITATGVLQSGGRKAFDLLVGGVGGLLMAAGRFDIWIGFIDAKTGEVTALLREQGLGGKTGSDPEAVLTKSLTAQLKKLQAGRSK